MNARTLALAIVICVAGCRTPEARRQPRYDITVSTGAELTVLRAGFQNPTSVAWSSPDCVGVHLDHGREPPSLDAGRVEVWIAGGAVVGHVDPRSPGDYQAQVRGALPPGARVVASVAGTNVVAGHRFTRPAPVPAAVRRMAPASGFRVRPGEPLRVTWSDGDSSDVAVLVTVAHGSPDTADAAWMLSCVVPRAPGGFTIPPDALSARWLPPDADTVTVAITADSRVTEGDYALDVTPIGTTDDLASGSVGP